MEHHPLLKLRSNQTFTLPEIVGEDFKAFMKENLSAEEYHADKTAMSSTGIRKILKQSPAHFLSHWTGMDDDDGDVEKEHFRYGRIVHMALLEPKEFLNRYVIEPEFTGKTKDGKESKQSKEAKDKRAAWWAQQHESAIIVTQQEYNDLIGTVGSIQSHEQARNILRNGMFECSGWFRDPETGVKCRFRPDCLTPDPENPSRVVLVDFKTTRDSSEGLFSHHMAEYQYQVQLAFYALGLRSIYGEYPTQIGILYVEKTAPYDVGLTWLDDDDFEDGMRRVRHALEIYKVCRERNQYPGRQKEAKIIRLPKWAREEPLPTFEFQE